MEPEPQHAPTTSSIVSTRGEALCTGEATLDASRRHVVTRASAADDGAVWQLLPAAGHPAGSFRLRNSANGEFLYTGSNTLDASRRRVLTWVGGGDVAGDDAVWALLPADRAGCFRVRNAGSGEFLYTGSNTLDADSRIALTWIGGEVEGDDAVWAIQGLSDEGVPPARANDPLAPNARTVLGRASQLAAEQRCGLVGTEHLLLALLTIRTAGTGGDGVCTTARWLADATGQSVAALEAVAREFAATTAGASGNARRSRSLERGVELGCAIGQPAQTEHLLLGTLLAAELDGQPNAATRICAERGVDTNALQQACGVSAAQLVRAGRACPGGVRQFGLEWGEPIPAAAGAAAAAAAAAAPPADMRGPVAETHYVYPNLICGQSAGLMSADRLRTLVEAGVDTFVCLQESYRECKIEELP